MDIDEDTCDDVIRSPFTALSAAPQLITPQKRRLDSCESEVKRARRTRRSELDVESNVPGSAAASPAQPSQRPAMTTAPTTGATGVSAVAPSQRPNSRCRHRATQSIPGVCFAHSCRPKSEDGNPPDGEQSDDETHQARHGRCAKLAKGKACYPRCEICKDIHQCPRCSFKLQLPHLQHCASLAHNGGTFTWIAERKRS